MYHDSKASWQNLHAVKSGETMEKALLRLAESWFGMKTSKSQQAQGASADVFVYAKPPTIDCVRQHHGGHSRDAGVPLIIMTSNPVESASLTADCKHQLSSLGRIPEIISHP